MGFEVVTPPAALLQEEDFARLKSHLVVDEDDWDSLISGYAMAAERMVENHMRQFIMRRDVRASFDRFADLALSLHPVVSVISIDYLDQDGDAQVVPSEVYRLLKREGTRISLAPGHSWPEASGEPESISVTYRVGMVENSAQMDPVLLQAIYLQTAYFMENRGDTIKDAAHALHPGVEVMVNPWRVWF